MEKLPLDAEYDVVVRTAKELKIGYVGVKKPLLIEKINNKIDQLEVDGVQAPQVEDKSNEQKVDTPANEDQKGNIPQRRVKKAKWFEEDGVELPYQAGDIVEVTGGDILIGRKAQVVKMSAKRDALKAILIHPIKGTLQGCTIVLDFWKIKMAEDQTPPKGADEEATDELIKDDGVQADNNESEESEAV